MPQLRLCWKVIATGEIYKQQYSYWVYDPEEKLSEKNKDKERIYWFEEDPIF